MTNSDNGPVDARTVASQLDATDGVILDMLEKDGRATLSHLSEATGLSVSAVQSRVQKLERRGVIRGYKAVIDDERRRGHECDHRGSQYAPRSVRHVAHTTARARASPLLVGLRPAL